MPSPGELIGELVRIVGEVLGASSLRLGIVPTLVVLSVALVLLQLVARPVTRWQARDPGGLAGVAHAMALAAEAGHGAVVSLGSAGVSRAVSAIGRLQTLTVLPILAHVGRAAARAGVPLEVLVNDPLAGVATAATIGEAHRRTATPERAGRSRVVFVGEGRPAAAGMALASYARPAAGYVVGGMSEEALLLVQGTRAGAEASTAATADGAQAPSMILGAEGWLIGPELYGAAADLRGASVERTGAIAANRLLVIAAAVLVVGGILSLAGVADLASFILGAD